MGGSPWRAQGIEVRYFSVWSHQAYCYHCVVLAYMLREFRMFLMVVLSVWQFGGRNIAPKLECVFVFPMGILTDSAVFTHLLIQDSSPALLPGKLYPRLGVRL